MKTSAFAAATALLVLAPVGAAVAAPPPAEPTVLASGLVGPLHLSVGPGKAVTVSEEFAGVLSVVGRDTTQLYANPGWDVAGTDHQGSTTYLLESQGAGPEDPRPLAGSLKAIDSRGRVTTITDQLGAYETTMNPDGGSHYGLSAADAAANPACVAELGALGAPASYTGELDSHPYAVAVRGTTAYVADAGANAVLTVDLKTGHIATLAVLPPRPLQLSAEQAGAIGVPSCAGLTYAFEPVPTDVAIGPDGAVYVSSLPGGPESPVLGARGAVFRVDPASGAAAPWVEGLLTPTGIAFDGSGNLYVASLFGDGVLEVPAGSHTATLFMPAAAAADVDVSGSTLYATTDVFGNGTLVAVGL